MARNEYGVWEVTLHAKDGQPVIPHNTKVKVQAALVDFRKRRALSLTVLTDVNDSAFWGKNRKDTNLDNSSHARPISVANIRRHILEPTAE